MDLQTVFLILAVVAFLGFIFFTVLAVRSFIVQDIRSVRADLMGRTRQEGIEKGRSQVSLRNRGSSDVMGEASEWKGLVKTNESERNSRPSRPILKSKKEILEEQEKAAVSLLGTDGGDNAPAFSTVSTPPRDERTTILNTSEVDESTTVLPSKPRGKRSSSQGSINNLDIKEENTPNFYIIHKDIFVGANAIPRKKGQK